MAIDIEEMRETLNKVKEEKGIINAELLNQKIKSLEEKIMILENNDTYSYSDFNTRIKQLEASVSILLSKMKWGIYARYSIN